MMTERGVKNKRDDGKDGEVLKIMTDDGKDVEGCKEQDRQWKGWREV